MKPFVLFLSVFALAGALACQKIPRENTSTTTSATTSAPKPASQPAMIEGLSTPESVLYDPDQDVYFISNINGSPLALDNNGFISRVTPGSLALELRWIEGGKGNVTLNGPKGMALLGNTLYVSDIGSVRKFNRRTGAPEGEIRIPGSTFLNDLVSDGKVVYVSDSGMKADAKGGFASAGTEAVWKIKNDKATKIASGTDLHAPNGLEVADGKVWVVSFGSNELYSLDKGKKANVATLPKGQLDGLIHMSDGTFLVTSWEGSAVYRGPAAGPFTAIVENAKTPADIGYDTKRHLLLIPHFQENVVSIHDVR